MDVLNIVWLVATVLGLLCLLLAAVRADQRRAWLLGAAGALAVAGVLGILSIGVIQLVVAVGCALAALRSTERPARRAD